MKKMNLNSLALNKKSISSLDYVSVKGGADLSMPLTKCKLPLDDNHTFLPIPNPDDDGPI